MRDRSSLPQHFYSLDTLRGLAALAIVFWHWQNFFFQGTQPMPFEKERQPLYFLFQPFYTGGWRAVELFFCLSGFIFFWLYSNKIERRKIGLKDFAVLRLSRLYPLHLATLIIVAAGQIFMRSHHGAFFVYPNNDLYHFKLQLIFASNWGFERGYSFNGPIWSVSVEILLYAAFFFVCFFKLRRWWHIAFFALIGYLISRGRMMEVGTGVLLFFIGCLSFKIFTFLNGYISRKGLRWLVVVLLLLWIFIPLNNQHLLLNKIYQQIGAAQWLMINGRDVGGLLIARLTEHSFNLILFPLTIITLALLETRHGTFGKRFILLGNISYSTYLLHFPLQLLFAALALTLGLGDALFYSPLTLLIFFGVLIPLSWLCYKYFERPAQLFLRKRFAGRQ